MNDSSTKRKYNGKSYENGNNIAVISVSSINIPKKQTTAIFILKALHSRRKQMILH
jgi:hypothetical protein